MATIARSSLRFLTQDRRGVTSLEYGVLALVALLAMVAFLASPSGGLIQNVFGSVFTLVQSVVSQ